MYVLLYFFLFAIWSAWLRHVTLKEAKPIAVTRDSVGLYMPGSRHRVAAVIDVPDATFEHRSSTDANWRELPVTKLVRRDKVYSLEPFVPSTAKEVRVSIGNGSVIVSDNAFRWWRNAIAAATANDSNTGIVDSEVELVSQSTRLVKRERETFQK